VQVLAVPVKALARAKTRLEPVLSPPERALLTLAMLEDVLDAAEAQPEWQVWVVSGDPEVLRVAGRRGVHRRPEAAGTLLGAIREVEGDLTGEDVLAVLLADLPALGAAGLRRALAAASGHAVAGAPAGSDGGTNLLVRRPPRAIRARFGRDSFARHRAAAEAAGLFLAEVREPELAFDLDRPADLRRVLRERRAGRTLDVCVGLGLSDRLREPAFAPEGSTGRGEATWRRGRSSSTTPAAGAGRC
jgi:2-phospho-L-lactate guanylyltransferase